MKDKRPKIEKGIPIPKTRPRHSKYPFEKMHIGDSFYWPDGDSAKALHGAARQYAGIRNGFRITIRKEKEGYRVWRKA